MLDQAIKKLRTKYPAKLNSSFKIPRIFALEQILDLTKSEIEVLLCLYESSNARGIIREYNHSQYVNTFDIPFESWMRGFRKLEEKGFIILNERTHDLIIKDYWKLLEKNDKNSTDQKHTPLSERNNMGGYIKASWKLLLSGKLRALRPRALKIFLYCYCRIDVYNTIKKNHSMGVMVKTLCEIFRLAPCDLDEYIKEIIDQELLIGEFDSDKKLWEFNVHQSIYDAPEDTFSFLIDLQLYGGAKLEWISSKIHNLLHECKMLTKVKPTEVIPLINLSKKYGHYIIQRILSRLYFALYDKHEDAESKPKWPNKFIAYINGAINNLINEGVITVRL